jgi:hypothetical protein
MARTLSVAACQLALRPVEGFADFAAHVRALLDGARDENLAASGQDSLKSDAPTEDSCPATNP